MGCLLKGGGGLYARLVVGAVLLAAGEAKRMGGRPKPLLELAGVPLIRRNLIALSGAGVDEVVVVTGHRADEVETCIREFPVTIAHNPNFARGQAGSVRTGLAALGGKLDAVIVAPADQPLLNAQDVTELISAFKQRGEASIVVPRVDGRRANPIVFEAGVREAILGGAADLACRRWIDEHPAQVKWLDTGNAHFSLDLDTPEDLERFAAEYGHRLRWPSSVAA